VQGDEQYEFHPDDLASFQRFSVGQTWSVETNRAGSITPNALK
jgi:hypothetical protein